jgi:branched-chain amino acid transport system substrate-binding protein
MTGRLKSIVLFVVLAVLAACSSSGKTTSAASNTTVTGGGSSVAGQTTTSSGSSGASTAGLTADGNAKAVAAVAKDTLSGTAGTGLTRGVSSSTVKVGCYLQLSGWPDAQAGFKARFQRANSTNELPGGRKIDFGSCQDDGGSPQTNLQIVQKDVQQDQDFAMVGISSFVQTPSTDFMGANQVPFEGFGYVPGFCGTRWGYGFNGCLITNFSPNQQHVVQAMNGVLVPLAAAKLTPQTARIALQANEGDAGTSGNASIGAAYKMAGANVVYNEANIPSPPPGDFSPFVNAINAAKPNLVVGDVESQTGPPFAAAVAASGYKGAQMNYISYSPGSLAKSPQLAKSLDGVYVELQVVPQELQTPYIKQMEKDLTAISAPTFITFSLAVAYAEADVLISQLKAVGADLNTKTWDQTINGGGYVYKSSVDGGGGQMSFPSMHFMGADCGVAVQIQGTNYVAATPYSCYDSIVVSSKSS